MAAIPNTGGLYSTWKDQESFTYRGCSLELRYQAEPPHGDFLYSLDLLKGEARHRLPLWIFGRSLFFFGPSHLLAESVPAGCYSDLKSVIVDLSSPQYTCLDSWYRGPQLTGQGLWLTRFHDSAPLLLTPSTPFVWVRFADERSRP